MWFKKKLAYRVAFIVSSNFIFHCFPTFDVRGHSNNTWHFGGGICFTNLNTMLLFTMLLWQWCYRHDVTIYEVTTFQVQKCFLMSGDYPQSLLDLQDKYDVEHVSENGRPGKCWKRYPWGQAINDVMQFLILGYKGYQVTLINRSASIYKGQTCRIINYMVRIISAW